MSQKESLRKQKSSEQTKLFVTRTKKCGSKMLASTV